MKELINRLEALAEKVVIADKERKDKLNSTSGLFLTVFDKQYYLTTQAFFKALDWHGEYGEKMKGPQKIIAIADYIRELELDITGLEESISELRWQTELLDDRR